MSRGNIYIFYKVSGPRINEQRGFETAPTRRKLWHKRLFQGQAPRDPRTGRVEKGGGGMGGDGGGTSLLRASAVVVFGRDLAPPPQSIVTAVVHAMVDWLLPKNKDQR